MFGRLSKTFQKEVPRTSVATFGAAFGLLPHILTRIFLFSFCKSRHELLKLIMLLRKISFSSSAIFNFFSNTTRRSTMAATALVASRFAFSTIAIFFWRSLSFRTVLATSCRILKRSRRCLRKVRLLAVDLGIFVGMSSVLC